MHLDRVDFHHGRGPIVQHHDFLARDFPSAIRVGPSVIVATEEASRGPILQTSDGLSGKLHRAYKGAVLAAADRHGISASALRMLTELMRLEEPEGNSRIS